MAITCPRCSTDVPDEARYCPYCNLAKPKGGPNDLASKPVEAPKHSPNRSKPARHSKPARRLRLPVVGLAAIIAVFSVGIYIYVVPLVYSEEAEPKTVLAALDKLRHSPSNEPDLTIDARLMRELEKSRRSGNLLEYQGWVVQPVKGTRTRILLVFSYHETGDVQQRAEWLADLTSNTFTPQTELAVLISK
jgi:hypothetical protein